MKKKLLIINKESFGSLTDSYKWCEYLRDEYDVSFLCFENSSGSNLKMDGVKFSLVSNFGPRIVRGIRFILRAWLKALFFRGPIIVVYFPGCVILKKLLPFKKMQVDIRTLAVWGTQKDRDFYDAHIRQACKIYDVASVISKGVANRIGNVGKTLHILPLGSDPISLVKKNYDPLRLFYVGCFEGRNITQTLQGFKIFVDKHPNVNIKYNLVGGSFDNEFKKCQRFISKNKLENKIILHGNKPHNQLKHFMDQSNVGVSYVPITPYYDFQPVTKTFEYALSGLYVIATATQENRKVINSNNGVLIKDTPNDFCKALEYVYYNRNNINENMIRQSLSEHTWENIVNNKLRKFLKL